MIILIISTLFIVTFGFGQPSFIPHDITTSADGAVTVYAVDVNGVGTVGGLVESDSSSTVLVNKTPILIKPFIAVIYFYQNYLGRIKGNYCPMYPSCSEYGKEAILNKNYVGILMTFDRLHRCSHDLENYEIIIIDGEIRYLDEPN